MTAAQRSAREQVVQAHIHAEVGHELFTGFPDFSLEFVEEARGRRSAIFTFADDDKLSAEIVYDDRLTVLTQLGVT